MGHKRGGYLRSDEDAEEQRQDGKVDALPDRHVRCAIARLAPDHCAHEAHEGRVRLPRRARRRSRRRVLYKKDAGRGCAINNCKNQKLRSTCQRVLERVSGEKAHPLFWRTDER